MSEIININRVIILKKKKTTTLKIHCTILIKWFVVLRGCSVVHGLSPLPAVL